MKGIVGCIIIALYERVKKNIEVIEYYKKRDEEENVKESENQNEFIKKIIIKTRTESGRKEFIKLLEKFIES